MDQQMSVQQQQALDDCAAIYCIFCGNQTHGELFPFIVVDKGNGEELVWRCRYAHEADEHGRLMVDVTTGMIVTL